MADWPVTLGLTKPALLAEEVASVAERSLLDANPALFPPNPATITVPSGDLIATVSHLVPVCITSAIPASGCQELEGR